MMINGFSPFITTHLSYQGANQFFGGSDTRMALANGVTGQETPDQLATLAAIDKAASLEQVQGSLNAQYANAWQAANDRKREEARQRGGQLYIFG